MADFFSYLSWFQMVLLMVALMSGILSIVREWVLIHAPEKANEKRLFYGCLKIAFILSALTIWGMEHHDVVSLHEKLDGFTKPLLVGSITSTIDAPAGPDNSWVILTMGASINNRGAPTILDQWAATLRLGDGELVDGEVLPPPMPSDAMRLWFGKDNKTRIMLTPVDHLVLESKPNPIATGGGISGWVQFLFRVREQSLTNSTLTLSFKDVMDVRHSITKDIPYYDSGKMPLDLGNLQQLPVDK